MREKLSEAYLQIDRGRKGGLDKKYSQRILYIYIYIYIKTP